MNPKTKSQVRNMKVDDDPQPTNENEEARKYLIMKVFYEIIVERVNSTNIMKHLHQLPAMSRNFKEITKLNEVGKSREAMVMLLDNLIECDEPGKWKLFIDSVKHEDYDQLYNCLEYLKDMPSLKDDENYRLIGIFLNDIINNVGLENTVILPWLHQNKIISENELQSLRNCVRNRGEEDAWLDLFSFIHNKSSNWYNVLLEAFIKNRNYQLVKKIDPKFLSKREGKTFNNESMDYEEDVLTVEESDAEMPPVLEQTTEGDLNCKELELRPYQEKLSKNALKGENVIICAPTGSGKTYIATKIILEHIKSREGREICKVAFLVNQVALAEQQSGVLKEYLNQRIGLLTGDTRNTDRVPLAKLLPITDIVVMTAQILVDAIAGKEIDVTAFSLIIFDECHHTKARHPYNQLMNRYIDLKLKNGPVGAQAVDPIKEEHGRVPNLPQIVGLTASLGVGRASGISGAMDHVISLCANLDVNKVCTTDEQGTKNMTEYINVPVTSFKRATGRLNDLFHKTVAEIMLDIENEMKESPFLQSDEEIIKTFKSDHLNPPRKKGNENYTQWVNVLKREVARFDDPKARKFFVTCQKMLDIYNTALIINNDCRSKDSLEYIEEELSKIITPNQSKDTRQKVMKFFENRKARLQEVSKKNSNPKLEKLKEMIINAFEINPDSRAIVFVKTLSLVQKVKKWMEETPELVNLKLNPEAVTGARASSDKGGMSKNRQLEVLECFKVGSGKLIIATSVAEEGLDIQKCNLVIRYDHVTNEIAMVQSRGRARAANSQFMVVTGTDSNSEKKEQMNLSRELLMKQAVQQISQLEHSDFTQKVLDYQKKAKIHRDSEKRVRNGRIIEDSEFELRCFQCNTLACFSSDIKTIKHSSFTVISEKFSDSYVTREHPTPTEFKAGFMKKYKIYCRGQDCMHDWGIIAIYQNTEFPLIKIESFVIVDSDGMKTTVKKWKNVPFRVPEISDDDLRRRLMESSGNRSADDSGDDLN